MARPSRLSKIPVADLTAELARRQSQVVELKRHHDELATEVDRLRAELEALGASNGAVPRAAGRRGRRRARNKTTLPEALAAALGRKTMSIGEMMDAVRAAGYRSKAKSFRTVVSLALLKSGKFKRVERGRYTAK